MDFFSVMPGEKSFRAASAVRLMEMGTSFGNVLTPLWFKFVKILSFTFLIQREKRTWPTCLLWHGWLPALDGTGGWAVGVSAHVLDSSWGYTPHILGDWTGSEDFATGASSGVLAANLDVWTDGSAVRDEVTGVCCGKAGVFAMSSGGCWFHRSWEHLDLLPPDENSGSEQCRLYLSVPQPLHTVQRAELWGFLLHFRPLGQLAELLHTKNQCDLLSSWLMVTCFLWLKCWFWLGWLVPLLSPK